MTSSVVATTFVVVFSLLLSSTVFPFQLGVGKLSSSSLRTRRCWWSPPPLHSSSRLFAVTDKRLEAQEWVPSLQKEKEEDEEDDGDEAARVKCSKIRRLKDKMWLRETLEDLTAAEFASSLDETTPAATTAATTRQKQGAVDFENLLSKLEKRIQEMCVYSITAREDEECLMLDHDDRKQEEEEEHDDGSGDLAAAEASSTKGCWELKRGLGMGSIVSTHQERQELLSRLVQSRSDILFIMQGADSSSAGEVEDALGELRTRIQRELTPLLGTPSTTESAPTLETTNNTAATTTTTTDDTLVFIRDDGTIDWDGALQDREAMRRFGISVWARINGQNPQSPESPTGILHGTTNNKKEVTARIDETPAIREKKRRLEQLQSQCKDMEAAHTALLNSAVSAGSAVANVRMAALDPSLRAKIRASSAKLVKMQEAVSLETLNYELERIFTYLESELGNAASYLPLQDRLNVAEFGLLESQIEALYRQGRGEEENESIDSDVLAVVLEQLQDFKRRLGIDYYVNTPGLTNVLDWEALQIWAQDLWASAQEGLAFYVRGIQLLTNDVTYCASLLGRATRGYTLKPREVRTLRRTFRDVITFVPVVIIFIIPLTPVGHVLVFGAIQRFFPEFFPSCFTERRQNLLQLYESTEFSDLTINENLKEKLARLSQAIVFLAASATRRVWVKLGGGGGTKKSNSSEAADDSG